MTGPRKTKFTFTRYSFGESCELPKEEKTKEAEDIFARREIIGYLMAHFTTQEASTIKSLP